MFVMFSLFHIPGSSLMGGSTSLPKATSESESGFAPTSSQSTTRLSTFEQQSQPGFSFSAPSSQVTKVTVAKLATTANAIKLNFGATLDSTPSTGELCSGMSLI